MHRHWGEIPISDAHVHFFTTSFFNSLAKQKPGLDGDRVAESLGWETPPADPGALADVWVAEMDRHHVRRAALIGSAPGEEQAVAAAIARHPDRFYGYFLLDPTAGDARARVDEAFAAGLKGICLFPAMHRYSMHDDRVRPVLEAAAARPGTLVFVHCGVLSVGVRKKLGLVSHYDLRYSNPVDLHAIAMDFPHVPFVIPHFGAGYFREALMVSDLCHNVYLDTSSSNSWMRYQPESLTLNNVFRRALDVVGAQRLLFGSDSSFYPRGWHAAIFEAQSKALYELGLSADEAALIFGANLDRLLASHT
jgi:uncharacterized protein